MELFEHVKFQLFKVNKGNKLELPKTVNKKCLGD